MADSKSKDKAKSGGNNNAVIIILVLLVVVAVGAGVYLSGQLGDKSGNAAAQETAQAATSEQPAAQSETANAEAPVIEPGNPVVAKIGGQDITRLEVFNFIQTLPANTQQLPIQDLFPLAVNQVVNSQIINQKVQGVNLDNDPAVKQQLEAAKAQIVRGVFVQNEVRKAMTDERLKVAYDQYVANFPEVPEVKTRHILVEEEAEAKAIIEQIQGGADFAEIAKEKSIDSTKENGGELGYISKQDQVIPEYIEASFKLEKGELTAKPVKSEFGYHVIEALDVRNRPPADFDQAKPFLAAQLSNVVLNELLNTWRSGADVTILDINGKAPGAAAEEPAAGEETPDAPKAE